MMIFSSRLLEIFLNKKFEACLNTVLYIAFKYSFFICNSFGCKLCFIALAIDSESCQRSFPSFCAQPFEVDVLFNRNLSICPFLGQVVDLDLLLCQDSIWNMWNDYQQIVGTLSEAMSIALDCDKFSIKILFKIKKGLLYLQEIYKAFKHF